MIKTLKQKQNFTKGFLSALIGLLVFLFVSGNKANAYWPSIPNCNSCDSAGGVCIEGGSGYYCEGVSPTYYSFEDDCGDMITLPSQTASPCPSGETCKAYQGIDNNCGNTCIVACDCSAPTCPAGASTTYTGPNCDAGPQTCADGCLSRTVNTGTTCYNPETNFTPATPSTMYVCLGNTSNCTSLSTNSSSPTTIDLPSAGTAVYIKTQAVTDYGGSRNGLQYLIQVNNRKNGWPDGIDDHSSGWIDNNYTVNLRNSIGLSYEASYEFWSYSGTQNVCDDSWNTGRSSNHYLRINACSGTCTPTCSVGSTIESGPDCYTGISSCTDVCGDSHTGSDCYTPETNFDPNPPAPVYVCTGSTSNCVALSTNSSSPTMIDLPSSATAVYIKSSVVSNPGGSEDGLRYLHQVNNQKNYWNSTNMYADDYSSGWITQNYTANLRNVIGLSYDASYQIWAYSKTENVCDSGYETGETSKYYFKINPEPCDNTCTLTCSVGTSTTYSGSLCAQDPQSCTDECGDLHTGSTCYLPETNTTPSLPSQMYFCTGNVNNCVALSGNSSSPTIIDLPSAGTTVYLKSSSVSWPSNARDLDYQILASDWGSVSYDSGWIGDSYTGNISSTLNLAYDKNYYVYSHTRSLNRCDNSWRTNSTNDYFYFRIAEEPCNDTCSLTCPVGSSTTYSGPLCTNGTQSCVDGCGDTHTGSSICYLAETNTVPNLPSLMTYCDNTSCSTLSTDIANPTVLNLPTPNLVLPSPPASELYPVSLEAGIVSPPANSRALEYMIIVDGPGSDDYFGDWSTLRTASYIYDYLNPDYGKTYYATVYTRSQNRCDDSWLVNTELITYVFKYEDEPCDNTCAVTCPSGSSFSNTGPYCTGPFASCVDECGDTHSGSQCYYDETNSAPLDPEYMYYCVGDTSNCSVLSTNPLNPTVIELPSSSTDFYISAEPFGSIPSGSRGAKYLLASNNLVNGWSGDCGSPLVNDYCSGWLDGTVSSNLRNSIGMQEGASYQTMVYNGTLDRCDDDIKSSGMGVGYFTICSSSCSCTPTCDAGTDLTNTGPYCADATEVCSCTDSCGDSHDIEGSMCYLPETNIEPEEAEDIYYCVDGTSAGNCTALSDNPMNPTVVQVPGASQQVYVKSDNVVIPVGSNSRGIEYMFMVNNLVNNWSGDCGLPYEFDYCRDWGAGNTTADLRDLVGIQGGAVYQLMTYASTLDRCDDERISNGGTYGYLRFCTSGCSCSPTCSEGSTDVTGPYCVLDDSSCSCVDDCGVTNESTGDTCYLPETNLEPEAPDDIYLCIDGSDSEDCLVLSDNPMNPTIISPPPDDSTLFIKVDDVEIPVGSNSRGIEYQFMVNNLVNGWDATCSPSFENDYCGDWQSQNITPDIIDDIGIDSGEDYQTWAYVGSLDRCDDDLIPTAGVFGYFSVRRAPSCDMTISHDEISHLSEEDLIASLTVYDGDSSEVDVDWNITEGCGSLNHETSTLNATPGGVNDDNQIDHESSIICQGDGIATVWVDLDDGDGDVVENACSVDFEITNTAPAIDELEPDVNSGETFWIGNEDEDDDELESSYSSYSCEDNNPITFTATLSDPDSSSDIDVISLNLARTEDSDPSSIEEIDLYNWPLKVMFAQKWESYGGDGSANYTFFIKDGDPNVNDISNLDCYLSNGSTESAAESNDYCMRVSDGHNYVDGEHVTDVDGGIDYDVWYLNDSLEVDQGEGNDMFGARFIGISEVAGGDWRDASYVKYEIGGSNVYVHFVVAFEGGTEGNDWEDNVWEDQYNTLWYVSDIPGIDDGLVNGETGSLWTYNYGSNLFNFHLMDGVTIDLTPPEITGYFSRRDDVGCGSLDSLEVCFVQSILENRYLPGEQIDSGVTTIVERYVEYFSEETEGGVPNSRVYTPLVDDLVNDSPLAEWNSADIFDILIPPASSWTTTLIEGSIDYAVDTACNVSSSDSITMSLGDAWIKTSDGDVYSAMGYSNLIQNDYPDGLGNWSMASHWLSGGIPQLFGVNVQDPSLLGWNEEEAYYAEERGIDWYDRLDGMARRSECATAINDSECVLSEDGLTIDSILSATIDGIYYISQVASETPVTINSGAVCNGVKAIFVYGDLSISPDFTRVDNDSACMFIVSGDVFVEAGSDTGVSDGTGAGNSPASPDIIQAAFVTNGTFTTAEDTNEDQLRIEGSIFADNTSGASTEFNRDLSYTNNLLYPSEVIEYDPRYLYLFRDLLGRKLYSQFECGVIQESETCEWIIPEEPEAP